MARKKDPRRNADDFFTKKEIATGILADCKTGLKFKTENQKLFYQLLDEKEIIICSGGAGVGKSMLALSKALTLLKSKDNSYEKIVLIKPAVEAEEKLGYFTRSDRNK